MFNQVLDSFGYLCIADIVFAFVQLPVSLLHFQEQQKTENLLAWTDLAKKTLIACSIGKAQLSKDTRGFFKQLRVYIGFAFIWLTKPTNCNFCIL